jgi:hypothetical protein
MKKEGVDVASLFNQARVELYCPPVRLVFDERKELDEDDARVAAVNGTIFVKPDIIPRGCDPNEYLLWLFRHELSHVHYCPYDIKTAYSLEHAAYEIVQDWNLAYLATHIFSNILIDLGYLPRRFGELPYFARVIGKENRYVTEKIMHEIYLLVHPTIKSEDRNISEAAREILVVSSLDRTWHTKVQMIAHILSRLMDRERRTMSTKKVAEAIRFNPIHVREDFFPSTLDRFDETYGSISDAKAAVAFFRQWVAPRLSEEEMAKLNEIIKERLKTQRGKGEKKELRPQDAFGYDKHDEHPDIRRDDLSSLKPSVETLSVEPPLSTSMSKPYRKVKFHVEDVVWRKFWYKSRAEHTIIQYLSESKRHRPVWSIMRYPEEWYIEDEIEDLDIEASMDEGSLIPEVNTLKWVEESAPHGQSISSGFVPSAITVLDASQSMNKVRDDAGVAAFITYLSARRAGGQTSTIAFSTRYVSAGWEEPEEVKEIVLSMSFGEFTVFPSHEVSRLISENFGPCFVVIITDGGWQNIKEAVPALERIADSGHKIIIFLLEGTEYADRIEFIKRSPNVRIYELDDPKIDLQGLVLSESMQTYKRFLD